MKKIGLISDTHCTFDDTLREFLADVDEVWHAGDFGTMETHDTIAAFKPLRAVWGNVDGGLFRRTLKEVEHFQCEDVSVIMTHIGGYPKRYAPNIAPLLRAHRPKIFISGHSHILKVIYDEQLDLLHLNPGGAGEYGIHKVRTALRFKIDGDRIFDMEVGQWPRH